MKILLDRKGLSRLVFIAAAQYADTRKYYIARDALAIVVARNSIGLGIECENRVADAISGAEQGTLGFVFERNEGKPHSKLTIYRFVKARHEMTLSQFLDAAPQEET